MNDAKLQIEIIINATQIALDTFIFLNLSFKHRTSQPNLTVQFLYVCC